MKNYGVANAGGAYPSLMGRGRVHPAQVTGLTHRWATHHIHGHVHTHIPTYGQFKITTMNACFWTVGGAKENRHRQTQTA